MGKRQRLVMSAVFSLISLIALSSRLKAVSAADLEPTPTPPGVWGWLDIPPLVSTPTPTPTPEPSPD